MPSSSAFKPADQAPGTRSVDKALLIRIAAWLLAAVVAALAGGAMRG